MESPCPAKARDLEEATPSRALSLPRRDDGGVIKRDIGRITTGGKDQSMQDEPEATIEDDIRDILCAITQDPETALGVITSLSLLVRHKDRP